MTTTTDETLAHLHRAILEHPLDDLARLVYADRLDDLGEHERAEFIRLQCEIEKSKVVNFVRNEKFKRTEFYEKYPLERATIDMHDREMKILWMKNNHYDSANWEIWCWAEHREQDGTPKPFDREGGMTVTPHGSMGLGGPSNSCTIPVSGGGKGVHQVFTRGFISSIRLTAEQFEQHAVELFAQHPITEVVLSGKEPWETRNGYSWWLESMRMEADRVNDIIPPEIYDMLDGYELHDENYKRYPTRETALAALSRAAVRVGRRRAGLPEEYPQ